MVPVEGPDLVAEVVVGFGACPVQAQGNHLDVRGLDFPACFLSHQGAVGGQTHPQPFGGSVTWQYRKYHRAAAVSPPERTSTGEA